MRKLWLIVKREYLTRIKSRGFVIGTIVVPLIGVGFFAMTAFLATRQPSRTFRLAIVDESGNMAPYIASGLKEKLRDGQPEFSVVQTFLRPEFPDATQQELRERINGGGLDGYFLIGSDLNQPVELHTRNPDNFALLNPLTAAVNQALVVARLSARGVHVDDIGAVVRGANLQVIKVGRNGESVERGQSIGIAIGLVMLLYMALLMYGIITMRSVLEEKTTRTMEVLISAVQPSQLLAGKILGVAAVAFTQFLIWGVTLGALLSYGALMAAAMPGSPLSNLHVPPSLLLLAGAYFVCGYFLYSSMYAAIGAACSNENDAQQLQWPATAPLVFSVVMFSMILSEPSSRLAVVLSEIPFFTPILMTLRVAVQTPPAWQIALSFVLLAVATAAVVAASAKIYRVGILMYGKRPNLPELLRWLRYT
jgi:ABC-2 type transport system permease protein